MKNYSLIAFFLFLPLLALSQEEDDIPKSNIQEYTPSKLLEKGAFDIKWFNNFYTQTESTFTDGKEPRETYFTSTIDVFTGISEVNRFNVGLIVEFRSNIVDGDKSTARTGITSFAPAVKFNPIKTISNFTIQTAFHIPLISNEVEDGVFLDQKGFTFQNRFFYDYNFAGDKWQLFTELNTEFSFGKKEESFANNSLNIVPGVFLSYFPSQNFTILGLVQHAQRFGFDDALDQDYTVLGGGAKLQVSRVLNLEALYTKFVRGYNTGLGQTFNIGLRAVF